METHGENPKKLVFAIIPARYSSVRLPGKMLLPVAGKPLVLHTVERAREAASIDRVIVATDDERIFAAVTESGHEAVMTSPDHRSGSDRVAEVAETLPVGSIIVNVQGDEPVISPATIHRVASALISDDEADIATAYEAIEELGDLLDPNIVKVVTDPEGRALYFSRAAIPYLRDAAMKHGGDAARAIVHGPDLLRNFKKHTGIYAFRREYLLEFTRMQPTFLEQAEMLEQLRAIENGACIKVIEAAARSIGVDTEEDLELVRAILESEERAHEIVA